MILFKILIHPGYVAWLLRLTYIDFSFPHQSYLFRLSNRGLLIQLQLIKIKMKKIKYLVPAMVLTMSTFFAFSQNYQTASDTVKLNKEYVEVSNDIADLSAKLTIAQNNLPGYNTKADAAVSDAQNTSAISSEQAAIATNGDVKDARKAKRKAKHALKDAKDLRHANNNVDDQREKIADLTAELAKKQARLQELDTKRTAIRNM